MVHAKGFQDKQDQYWILSVDLGFQPKKDPAKCLVKRFLCKKLNLHIFEIPLHSIKSVNVTVNVTNAPSVNHTQQNINESKSHSGN